MECHFSPNGEVIVTGDDSGHICIWGHTKTIIDNIKFHEEAITALAFSNDSAIMLSACSQGNVRLYNLEDGFESMIFMFYKNLESVGCEICTGVNNLKVIKRLFPGIFFLDFFEIFLWSFLMEFFSKDFLLELAFKNFFLTFFLTFF